MLWYKPPGFSPDGYLFFLFSDLKFTNLLLFLPIDQKIVDLGEIVKDYAQTDDNQYQLDIEDKTKQIILRR